MNGQPVTYQRPTEPAPKGRGEVFALFGTVAVAAAIWLLTAWLLMITVGVVHAQWIHDLPTIGFRVSMLLSALMVGKGMAVGVLGAIAKDAK